MEIKQNIFGKYKCPCCGFYTLIEAPINTFEDCPVCFWEIDGLQQTDADYKGGANHVSLNQAKENFKNFQAVEERFKDYVRPPLNIELA